MVEETILSGYCRQLDNSRMVTVERENGCVTDIDCRYESCVHRPNCPIAKEIEKLQ